MKTAIAVVYDELTGAALYGKANRADAVVSVSIAGLDPAALSGLHAYLVFSKPPAPGTGEQGKVSGTAYMAVSQTNSPGRAALVCVRGLLVRHGLKYQRRRLLVGILL